MTVTVSIYGAGQLGSGVARVLEGRGHQVAGPFSRLSREKALTSGADVVIIATATRLSDVAPDIETAIKAGSDVLVSAEECAFPWAVDRHLADQLDELARNKGVTVVGCGLNPGLVFDALVLTVLGATSSGSTISVSRTVDLSGFGASVLRRIGVGATAAKFAAAVRSGTILGHAGFPQSMHVVASALGVAIERIDKRIEPVISKTAVELTGRFSIAPGESAGVNQRYVAYVDGHEWYTCRFFGHVCLSEVGKAPVDRLEFIREGALERAVELQPSLNPQEGSRNMLANSIVRIVRARPGWVTVADLPPAYPCAGSR